MSDDPATAHRFPYVAALLCAACVAAAAWTWMRYSYRWDVSAEAIASLPTAVTRLEESDPRGRVSDPSSLTFALRGLGRKKRTKVLSAPAIIAMANSNATIDISKWYPIPKSYACDHWCQGRYVALSRNEYQRWRSTWDHGRSPEVVVRAVQKTEPFAPTVRPRDWPVLARGRAWISCEGDDSGPYRYELVVDVTRGRLHGASIAGLVVGAMGVFVFAAALEAWLDQRRDCRAQTAESDT